MWDLLSYCIFRLSGAAVLLQRVRRPLYRTKPEGSLDNVYLPGPGKYLLNEQKNEWMIRLIHLYASVRQIMSIALYFDYLLLHNVLLQNFMA